MEGVFLNKLMPILPTQSTITPTQGSPEEEEGAFQLLLENLLFETLAGQVFKEGSGLLSGIQIGSSAEDAQGEEGQNGQELLALLEMLQVPLMEHFRNSLPKESSLFQGNFSGKEPGSNVPMMSLTNLLGNTGGNGEPPTLENEQSFLARLVAMSDEEGQQLSPFKGNSQQTLAGNLTAIAKGNEPSEILKNTTTFQELHRDTNLMPEQYFKPSSSSLAQDVAVAHNAANNSKEVGQEHHQLNLLTGQIIENQEVGTQPSQIEGSSFGRSGITFLELTEQMINSGKLKLLATKQEMEIQLKPEYLGKLAIRLTLENGAMTAKFIVESHQVGRMLEQNLPQLKQTLADQGIRFDQAQVEVGDPGSFSHDRQPQWQQGRTPREPFVFNTLETLEHNEEEEYYLETNRKIGIDYRA